MNKTIMKILFLLLCVLISATINAKTIHNIVNPSYVGINDGTMKIVKVKTTETETTITFRYPGDGFASFFPSSYLVDEQGRRYNIISQKGFVADSLGRLTPKKKGNYKLIFSPLPKETRIFDFIEDFYSPNGTSYYGIRAKGTPFATNDEQASSGESESFPLESFVKDSVYVTGRIISDNPDTWMNRSIRKWETYSFVNTTQIPEVKIDSNGYFRMPLCVYGPTWANLLTYKGKGHGSFFIPVMLYPGDSIDIEIDCSDENNKKISYHSKKQNSFSNLMQHAPVFFCNYYRYINDTTYYNKLTKEAVENRFKNYDDLSLYIAGKYGLNGLETEMLRSHMSVMVAADITKLASHYLFKKYPRQPNSNYYDWEWRKSESPYFYCLSKVRAESNAFLTTPEWHNLLSFDRLSEYPKFDNQAMIMFWRNINESPNAEHVVPYFNSLLDIIREYRQKNGGNDSVFEQAFMLCCARRMPLFIPHPTDCKKLEDVIPVVYKQFTNFRSMFYHPSILRLASTVVEEKEQFIYRTEYNK